MFVCHGACHERACSQPPDHARSACSPEWKTGRPPLSSKARPPLANVREYCSGFASRRGQRAGKSGACKKKRAEGRRGQARAFEVAAGIVPAVALPAAAAVPAGKAAHWLTEAAVHRRQQRTAGRRRACDPGGGRGCGCGRGRGSPSLALCAGCPSLALCAGCCGAGHPCASPPPCVTADLELGRPSLAPGEAQDALARQPPRARAAPPPPPPRVCASASPLRTRGVRNAVHRPRRPRSTPSMLLLSSAMARVELRVASRCAEARGRGTWQRGARRWP